MPSLSQPRAVRLSLALSLLALMMLQAWRPFYFLTDDNLCGWTPVVVELGRSLAAGSSPFQSPHLYGGAHDLARDPANLCLWNPLVLALSLVGQTRAFVAIADIYASLNLLLCAFATAHLLLRLREMQAPWLSDKRIVLLTLSFTFSAYALIADASWATFSANQAALPVLMLGLLHPKRRTGTLLVAGGVLHALLGGHLSPLIFSLLFLGVFIAIHGLLSRHRESRHREMMARWISGGALALLVALPLLIPAARGFASTARSGSQSADFTSFLSIPLPVFVASFFGGKLSVLFENDTPGAIPSSLAHIVCCVAAFAVFHSIGARKKQSPLEWAFGLTALLTVVFIVRPPWLSALLSHIPILRSLRIPMREVLAFGFFIHGWIALRPVALKPPLRRASLVVGAALFATSFISLGPPSFSNMERDRRLLFSGQSARFWDSLRPQLQNRSYVPAIEVPIPLLNANLDRVPWSLLGAYNYAALFGVPSRSGYYIPGLVPQEAGAQPLRAVMGIYDLESARRLQKKNPEVVILSLTSLDPPRIDWIDGSQRRTLTLPPMENLGPLQAASRKR